MSEDNNREQKLQEDLLSAEEVRREHAQSGMDITQVIPNMNPRPTAIFALTDLMAIGALRAAAEAGCSVPNDLAVVGYDDLKISHFTNPPLTTVSQPKQEIGAQAINLLVDRMSQKSRPPNRVVLEPELIIRDRRCA